MQVLRLDIKKQIKQKSQKYYTWSFLSNITYLWVDKVCLKYVNLWDFL